MADRISDLPEFLMCHILWFLPTKEAVATSILSNSWKSLWKLVPRLDLDIINTTNEAGVSFVSRVLAQQQAEAASHRLQTFRLRCATGHAYSHLYTWLCAAAARKVEDLDLHIDTAMTLGGERLELARSVFSCCRTLVVLKLSGFINIDIDISIDDRTSSIQFPSLKILQLLQAIRTQEHSDSFSRLLFGCPVLEDLTFTLDFSAYNKICVPSLKRLSIRETANGDKKYEINAPALEYFHFRGGVRDIKFHEKPDNLVQANLYIWAWTNVNDESYKKRVFKLLVACSSVKVLSISFSPCGKQNLVRVDFNTHYPEWNVLQNLLQIAPNLETLVLAKGRHNFCWKEPLDHDDSDFLWPLLTSFYYTGFEGLKCEVDFVKYILKKAKVLKRVTIQVSGRVSESKESVLEKLSMFLRCSTCLLTGRESESKESILEKLSMFPRCSTCLLTVE